MNRYLVALPLVAASLGPVACSDSADPPSPDGAGAAGTAPAAPHDEGVYASAAALAIDVPPTGRAYLRLADPAVVTVADPAGDAGWDLAFDGFNVFTNGGSSGGGAGGAFGPLDVSDFLTSNAPVVPFITRDAPGGAFLDWYAYDDQSHALWSRYHVVGVKDAGRLWKVQVLSYYGVRDGATVSALYRIRVADAAGSAITEIADLDGTAGGASAPPDAPSECLDLGTRQRTMLTPAAAALSSAWHLCFRRSAIRVNGEAGGPRGVGAVDLDEAKNASETVAGAQALTPASELARFEAAGPDSFAGRAFHGDRVVNAFTDTWLDSSKSPPTPRKGAYLVVAASGKRKFLVAFTSFSGSTSSSPGRVVVRIKPVEG